MRAMVKHHPLRITKLVLTLAVIALSLYDCAAQTRNKIELLGAKDLKFDKRMGIDAQRLIGDVRFRHQGALLYCDSAYLYSDQNSIDAFGNVYINQGDTLKLYSDQLNYNGDTRLVKVRNNVRLLDREMTLTTDVLDYNRLNNVAVFYEFGRILSTANQNELTSIEGVYIADAEMFHFRDSVVLINPKYRVETDTLDYNNGTEVAYFEGPTFIYSDENTIYCENGWYDTRNDIAQFNENAFLDNAKQVLRGDSLWYSRLEGLGRAYNNVSILDTVDNYIIRGNIGLYDELKNTTLVTQQAELVQFDQRDSLFLHADTLLAIDHPTVGNQLFAYHSARFFRKDMQGAADSIYFAKSDSIIHLYHSPVLWSDNLQITGDTMQIFNNAAGIDKLLVYENAMLIEQADSNSYNQIKGRRLTGYFSDNELYEVFIRGNGQSLYYALEERKVADEEAANDSSMVQNSNDSLATAPKASRTVETVIGVNKAICSNIAIYMENKKVQRIRFLVKPDGSFTPIELFDPEGAFLDGFTWQELRRPKDRYDIFRKAGPEVERLP
jgi:lipopolysaccharide export system protein LptA